MMRTFPVGLSALRAWAVFGVALAGANSVAAQECASDADCGAGAVCHAWTYTECSGDVSSCEKGDAGCPVMQPSECHEVTGESTCTARYTLPCQVAADCGPGFACEEQHYTVCSGGGMGGSSGASMGEAGSAGSVAVTDGGTADFECHEETSGSSACRLLDAPCTSNDDCVDGLECQNNPYYWSCSASDGGTPGAGGIGGSPASMGSAGTAGAVAGEDEDGGVASGPSQCVPSDAPSKVCAPHDYYDGGMYPGGNGGIGGQTGGAGDSGSAQDAGISFPNEGSAGQSGGAGYGSPGSGEGPSSGSDGDDTHHGHTHLPHFGCSVSGSDASTQLSSWFALIGLVAFGLRRRARRVG